MGKMIGFSIFGGGQCNILSGNGNCRGAEPLRKAKSLGNLVAFSLARARISRRFNVDRSPLRAQPIGYAFGMANDSIGALGGIDQDEHALARRPRPFNAMRAHVVDHLGVDPLCRPA